LKVVDRNKTKLWTLVQNMLDVKSGD